MPTIYKPKKKVTVNNQAYYQQRRKERQKIYNTSTWQKLRLSYMQQHPLCEECLKKGIIRSAKDIHHIISFMTTDDMCERERLAFDSSNLQALCRECHNEKHNKKGSKSQVHSGNER